MWARMNSQIRCEQTVAIREKPLILVVDDQVTIIRILTNMLQPQYEVCVATDGAKGIDVACTRQPDLILLDNMMPNMTGVETCQMLKKNPITQHIPVIFVTSMDDKHNEKIGLKVGAVDYINKPPAPEIVLARIGIHLRNQRQHDFIEQIAQGSLTDISEIRRQAQLMLADT
jgi:DNA-binding response OmpR family regulator